MTRSRLWLSLCMALLVVPALSASPAALTPTQAQSTAPKIVRQSNVPGATDTKFPDVVGLGNNAYIAFSSGSSGDRSARLSALTDPFATNNFVGPVTLGDADGASDYSPSVITSGPDGTLYFAWIRSSASAIYMRSFAPGASDWGPTRTIISGGSFRVRVEIGVTSDNKIMVMWDENSRYRYRVSSDGGASWSGTTIVSDDDSASRPQLARDNAGGLWLTYSTSGNSGAGRIKVGYWRGETFAMKDITADKSSANYFADSGIAVTPDNQPNVAWRDVNGGIYYAVRDPNTGNFNRAKLVGGKATSYGTVALSADAAGNLSLAWGGDTSGSFDVWYAFKPYNQNWQGPVQGSGDSDLDANAQVGSTLGGFAYGHVVNERFTSNGLVTRYSAFQSVGTECLGTLTLNGELNNGGTTRNVPLTGTITPGSGCTPALMQVSLNTPPTSKTAPAQVAYNGSISVPVPAEQVGTTCTQTVYVHLYKDANSAFSQQSIFSKSIKLDPAGDVDATVKAVNPNISGLSPTFTPFVDAPGSAGASNGDPAWTRSLNFYLGVNDAGDCSGLAGYAVGAVNGSITGGSYGNVLPIPAPASQQEGPVAFDVSITDGVGNVKAFSQTMNYDPLVPFGSQTSSGAPVASSATLAADTQTKSILRTITLTNVNVTDNLYRPNNAGKQFWGVWVAVAPRNAPSTDPATLYWTPIKVENPDAATITVPISLFAPNPSFPTGVGPRTDQDGKYTVFLKFLDGAGNASAQIFSTEFTLDPGYSLPGAKLPVVIKP